MKLKLKDILWWAASISLTALSLFFVFQPFKKSEEQKTPVCLRLWNVDTFEGGKGSRSGFLKRVAGAYTKKTGVSVLVSSLTNVGARDAFSKGDIPDLISFGIGAEYPKDYAVNLYGFNEKAFLFEEKRFAVWCKGGYFIFSKKEDFSALTDKNTVVSDGGDNLPSVALALSGRQGKFLSMDATTAYVQFLNGKFEYMVGTQRDICRFETKGVDVHILPIEEYLDLYQCVSVTSSAYAAESVEFVRFLLSEEMQKGLTSIGMASALYPIYSQGETQSLMEKCTADYVPLSFVGKTELDELKKECEKALLLADCTALKKFLKSGR